MFLTSEHSFTRCAFTLNRFSSCTSHKTCVQIFRRKYTNESPIIFSTSEQTTATTTITTTTTQRVSRHFVAVVPPMQVLDLLEKLQENLSKKMSGTRIRWVPRENIHFTLRFFGSDLSDPALFNAATDVITKVVGESKPFEVQLKGLGVFPKWKKPRVLFVGVGEGESEFKLLITRLEQEWKKFKIPPAKAVKLVPHVTLGRWSDLYVKTIQGDIIKDATANFMDPVSSFVVKEVVLMDSNLDAEYPVYTPLHLASMKTEKGVLRK